MFCKDDMSLIENYEEAINSEEKYDCHHRLETELNMSVKELKEKDLYYNRPASELIFLTHSEHAKLHHPKGKQICNEPWNKGKKGIYSEQYINKLSDSHKGHKVTEETKLKLKQYEPWMKGKHHTEYAKQKNREKHLDKIPWNKGMTKDEMKVYKKAA